jgi:hypothetical protein
VRREEHALDLLSVLEHRARVGGRRRDRLLAEHVEVVMKRGVGDGGVVARRRRDVDEIEAAGLGGEQGLGIRINPSLRQHLAGALAAGRADLGNRDDFEQLGRGEVRGHVALLGNESEPDERTLERTGHSATSAVE